MSTTKQINKHPTSSSDYTHYVCVGENNIRKNIIGLNDIKFKV